MGLNRGRLTVVGFQDRAPWKKRKGKSSHGSTSEQNEMEYTKQVVKNRRERERVGKGSGIGDRNGVQWKKP